jgi:hypothetical protein
MAWLGLALSQVEVPSCPGEERGRSLLISVSGMNGSQEQQERGAFSEVWLRYSILHDMLVIILVWVVICVVIFDYHSSLKVCCRGRAFQ